MRRNLIRNILWAFPAVCLLYFFPGRSAASDWKEDLQFSGHIKSYVMAVDPADIRGDTSGDDVVDGIADNKLRAKLFWQPSDLFTFELAYELMPTVQGTTYQSTLSFMDFESEPYRIKDIDRQLYPDEDDPQGTFVLTQNLDRAVLTVSPRFGDIHIGRQAVSFGKARVINPTDIIAPYNFNELDVEHRTGVDAVRLTLPAGDLGEIDSGMIFGRNGYTDLSAYYICSRLYVAETDISLLAVDFRENFMGGISVSRSVKGAGVWLEAAYTWARLFSDRDEEQDYFRATTGVDYNINLKNGIVVFLEYHYNGASSGDPRLYLWQTMETSAVAYQEGNTFLLGEHYLIPGFTTQLTPLISCIGTMLWNLTDDSVFYMPQVEYNVAENFYITVGAGIADGKKSSYDWNNLLNQPAPVIESEFGLYPEFYFASLKYYF